VTGSASSSPAAVAFAAAEDPLNWASLASVQSFSAPASLFNSKPTLDSLAVRGIRSPVLWGGDAEAGATVLASLPEQSWARAAIAVADGAAAAAPHPCAVALARTATGGGPAILTSRAVARDAVANADAPRWRVHAAASPADDVGATATPNWWLYGARLTGWRRAEEEAKGGGGAAAAAAAAEGGAAEGGGVAPTPRRRALVGSGGSASPEPAAP
jgi:hypothetical protein